MSLAERTSGQKDRKILDKSQEDGTVMSINEEPKKIK